MIELKQEPIAAAKALDNVRRRMAEIRQHSEAQTMRREAELHRFPRIVRNGDRQHVEVTDGERTIARDDAVARSWLHLHAPPGAGSSSNRDVIPPAQCSHSRGVIRVLVRDEHGIQLIRACADLGEAVIKLLERETAVDQDAGVPGANERAIAAATATETAKLQHPIRTRIRG